MATYTFKTSQPLTQYQIDFLNSQFNNLPFKDLNNFDDLPEWITNIEKVEE